MRNDAEDTRSGLERLALSLAGAGRADDVLDRAVAALRDGEPGTAWAILDRRGIRRYRVTASAGIGVPQIRELAGQVAGCDVLLSLGKILPGEDRLPAVRWHVAPNNSSPGGRAPDLVVAAWAARESRLPDPSVLAGASATVMGALRLARLLEFLLEQSNRDPLTQTLNRRGILDALRKEKARARRYGRPLSVLFLDLDRFKDVNELHGHPVGDEVLAHVGGFLTRTLRESDSVGRIGGDEFLVVLPDTDLPRARRIGRRIARDVSSTPAATAAGQVRSSVTIGASSLDENGSGEGLLERADQRMLDRKRRRRWNEIHAASARHPVAAAVPLQGI